MLFIDGPENVLSPGFPELHMGVDDTITIMFIEGDEIYVDGDGTVTDGTGAVIRNGGK